MKNYTNIYSTSSTLTVNLESIFNEAGNEEKFLTCRSIHNTLKLKFNYKIFLENLYIEMKKQKATNILQLFLGCDNKIDKQNMFNS